MESSFVFILLNFLFSLSLLLLTLKTRQRIKIFFQEQNPDLDTLLKKIIKETQRSHLERAKTQKKILFLEKTSQISFQKYALLRYNPFKNSGGNQSFSLVLLNKENSGFILTSLYTREGNRIYAKPIIKGKSEFPLSQEEKNVLEIALKK